MSGSTIPNTRRLTFPRLILLIAGGVVLLLIIQTLPVVMTSLLRLVQRESRAYNADTNPGVTYGKA